MGSPCELRLYAGSAAQAETVAQKVRAGIEVLEQRYSRYRPDSLTSRINAAAGTPQRIEVDEETAGLLDYAAQAWQHSDGLFDLTSGVLRRAWNFRAERLPEQAELDALLPLVGWQQLEWQRPWLRLPRSGMELDFGGIVKEYTADAAVQICRNAGVQHGLVELGGDIAVIGPHPDGTPWRIGICHPRAPAQAIAQINLHHGALASSGDYERYFIVGGKRFCHILNPKTGWPVQGVAAASVVADKCLLAGTVSTVAMLQGHAAADWLAQMGLPHLVIDADLKICGSLLTVPAATQTGMA